MPREQLSRHLAAQLLSFPEEEAKFIRAFCERHLLRDVHDVRRWLELKTRVPDTQQAFADGQKIYGLLTGKKFEPETFVHRSLEPIFSNRLACQFGTLDEFKKYVLGAEFPLDKSYWYAAWMYGLITQQQFQARIGAIRIKLYDKPFKKAKKIRRRKRRG